MSRSPLFDSLRLAIRAAAIAAREHPGVPPVDELIEIALSRRRFVRNSMLAAGGLLVNAGCGRGTPSTADTPPAAAPSGARDTRIAIVGGGMAGLNAAYKLQKAGLRATIFEAADRTGGRMFTASNLLADGITTELGGEFIDSSHEEVLALMDEFKLERLDTRGPDLGSLKPETYFINGRHYTQQQAARAFVPLAKRIFEDSESMEEVVDYAHEGGGSKFDRMTITQYLDQHRRHRLAARAARRRLRHRIRPRRRRAVGAQLHLPDRDRRAARTRRSSCCSAKATSATRFAAATSSWSTSSPSAWSRRSSAGTVSKRSAARATGSR